jgi:hypothetical protein
MDKELNLVLIAQAGLYALKDLGYFYIKNNIPNENERK